MGCFLACFGFHKRKKRRPPPGNRVTFHDDDRIHLSYEPLGSSRITTHDTSEKPEIQDSESRETPKEEPWVRIRKKVSFNLNLQTYETIPDDQHFIESDEEKESTTSYSGCYPQNHRYQNCSDCYDDEDDDFAYEESDLDDNEIDEDHDESNDEYKPCELESISTDGSQHVHSVLKPIENLTQWRTAKAKSVTITKQQMENKTNPSEQIESPVSFGSNPKLKQSQFKSRSNSRLPDPLMQENLVNTSLSDWLV